jgi:hypothetical protein
MSMRAAATCGHPGLRVVCVDINPAVVTKLSDRRPSQTAGVVTDVGLFLHRLAEALR